MHYNKAFYQLARAELHRQAAAMPPHFNSVDFCKAFAVNYAQQYDWLVQRYMRAPYNWDRPHAVQIAHREITHTLKNKCSSVVHKVGAAPNPNGGGDEHMAEVVSGSCPLDYEGRFTNHTGESGSFDSTLENRMPRAQPATWRRQFAARP